jgi:CDP-Glycerol:Poly(glycerophosphate) glycerophosphotransferase
MTPVTILVSVPHGASAGNMLRHGLLARLLGAAGAGGRGPEIRVVIASPLSRDAAFVNEFQHERVVFEDLPAHQPSGVEARLQSMMQAAYLDSGVTDSVRIRRMEASAAGTVRWVGAKARLARLLLPSVARPASRYDLSDSLVSHRATEDLFDRHEPSLLVVSSPGLIFSEVPLLRTARRQRVRAMAIDPSWDNFTNKLLPVRRVDRLLVWNELMRDQAISLHGYRAEEIRICGAPQFDAYFARGTTTTRDAFFRRIGADPARALITVTTTPRSLYAHHDHVVRQLSEAIVSGRIARPAQVLVRLHPRDDEDAYRTVRTWPHVIVEKPFRPTVKVADGLAVDVMPEHQSHLADTMRHSDVAVNVASTIAIEACVFDTPVVNISFDGEQPSEYVKSARRYYKFTHYVNITRHNAARVAETPVQMIDWVNRYLGDPSLDADGRRRVVFEQCQFLDGNSGARVAEAVVDELRGVLGWEMPVAFEPSTQAVGG